MKRLLLLFWLILLTATPSTLAATKKKTVPKKTVHACCASHKGSNFCDALTGRTVCVDGIVDKSCPCKYDAPYSDACSVAALYNSFQKKRASYEDVTDLSKKTWWTQCAPWTRKQVYSLVIKRKLK